MEQYLRIYNRRIFDSFEHKEIKIGDITFIGNKIEENRVNHGVFIFYPVDYKNESIYPCIYIYFKNTMILLV